MRYIGKKASAMIDRVLASNTNNFVELVAASGLSPSRDFRDSLLSGIDFRDCDLSEFNFSRTSFRDCQFSGAILHGALFEGATFINCHPSDAIDWHINQRASLSRAGDTNLDARSQRRESTLSSDAKAPPTDQRKSGRVQGTKSSTVAEQLELEALNLAADWADISEGLRKDLGHQLHSQWIKPIQVGPFHKEKGVLDLYLPTEFSANWVAERFFDRISLAWRSVRPDVRHVHIAAHPRHPNLPQLRHGSADVGRYVLGADDQISVALDPSLTFANFIVGNANVLACNAAKKMAGVDVPQFSPLYLKGASGQGKSHLLHAIGHAYLETHPRARIFYCSAERFMVEFVQALKSSQTIEFKARLRSFDLLLVDDIQFIIGKASAQEELLYTIDALLAEDKRLVFAADRAPQKLDGIDGRLLSRLSMGLIADIAPADFDLRFAILDDRLARFKPLDVPAEVIEFLARTITRNVRELVGGLNKLIAYAQLTGQDVSLQLAEEQLTDILSTNRRRITIDEIQRTVCHFYRIDQAEMVSKRRAKSVVRPRQIAIYLAKVLTPRSYPEIGRQFGGRDHSSIIHSVRLIEDLRARDADMDGDVRRLLSQLSA